MISGPVKHHHMAISSNMSKFYIENDENQFFELGGFFSSTMELNGSKYHPIVPFTLPTRLKDLDLTLVIYHKTLMQIRSFIVSGPPSRLARVISTNQNIILYTPDHLFRIKRIRVSGKLPTFLAIEFTLHSLHQSVF